MKKILSFIFSILIMCTLCGCSLEDIINFSSKTETTSSSYEYHELNIYSINDFHGEVKGEIGPGILSTGSKLKELGSQEDTILVNSGDMFQGSIESNYNYGSLLSECLESIGFSAMALGNHEFDWGVDYIKANNAKCPNVPFLGANIYHYDIDKKETLDYASDLVLPYTIVEKNNLKIGIIGTIGSHQITSISSQFVDDLIFVNPIYEIQKYSDILKDDNGENCDVVIAIHHGDEDELLNTGLTNISKVTNERYVDAVFCGHSHQNECSEENGVYFIQSGAKGSTLGQITLNVGLRKDSKPIVLTKAYSSSVSGYTTNCDAELKEIVDRYCAVTDVVGSEVLGTIASPYTYMAVEYISNLYCKACYEYAKTFEEYSDVLLCMGNNAREELNSEGGKVTYANLYLALPFDNQIIIGYCKGSDLINEASYSSTYFYRENLEALDYNKMYLVALLDYIGTHRNDRRNYDYFPSFTPIGILDLTYREITANYLRSLSGNIKVSDYYSSNPNFDRNMMY